MSINASNPFDTATVDVDIVVAESVVGASVTDLGAVTVPGQPKYFTVSFNALPSDAAVRITFGDGDNATLGEGGPAIGNPMEVSHVYVTSGIYTVTVTGRNNVSQSTATLGCAVSTVQDCKAPR